MAKRHGVPLVVDNTVATPIMLRPIEYGADIIVHSLTKFMGGHGTTLGGAIVDSGRFPWKEHARRFRMFNEPDASYHGLIYTEHFGERAYIARCRSVYQRATGAVISPLSSFLLLQGIETVALRVERHVENARRVAEFLRDDPRVAWVNYTGFPDNPYHALAQKYLGGRACSLMTFGIVGGLDAGKDFYDALKLFKRLVNLGDAKSLACHPASTTHRQMSAEEQSKAGVTPDLIRLSIGIEHVDDIIADLDQALAAAQSATRRAGRFAAGGRVIAQVENKPNAASLRHRATRLHERSARRKLRHRRTHQQHARRGAQIDRAAVRRSHARKHAQHRGSAVAVFHPRSAAFRYGAEGHGRPLPRRQRAVGHPRRRPDRHRHRAAFARPQGRAVLGCARSGHRLGARAHRFDDLVVPGGACRGAPLGRNRTAIAGGEVLRRVRLRGDRASIR